MQEGSQASLCTDYLEEAVAPQKEEAHPLRNSSSNHPSSQQGDSPAWEH